MRFHWIVNYILEFYSYRRVILDRILIGYILLPQRGKEIWPSISSGLDQIAIHQSTSERGRWDVNIPNVHHSPTYEYPNYHLSLSTNWSCCYGMLIVCDSFLRVLLLFIMGLVTLKLICRSCGVDTCIIITLIWIYTLCLVGTQQEARAYSLTIHIGNGLGIPWNSANPIVERSLILRRAIIIPNHLTPYPCPTHLGDHKTVEGRTNWLTTTVDDDPPPRILN